MAVIQGQIKIECYYTGDYKNGTMVPTGPLDIMLPLNQDMVIGRTSTEEEITAVCGPGFDPRWGYDGKKLILPTGKVLGMLSREHGQILVSYEERPKSATMSITPDKIQVVSDGSPLFDYANAIRIIYNHLSECGAPTTLIQKGQEPRVFKNKGESAEFSLDDLTEPLWLAIGFGTEEEMSIMQTKKHAIAPFLKVWYTG